MAEARMWRVHPNEETGEVDEAELNKSLYEAGVLLRRGGGAVQVIANRRRVPEHPSELPTERYTESVDIQWLARADTRPRFEEVAEVPAPAEPQLEVVPEPDAGDGDDEMLTVAGSAPDESAIPAGMR